MEALMITRSILALSDVCVIFEDERNVILTHRFEILPRSNRSYASKATSEYDSVSPQVVRISNDMIPRCFITPW